jgi:antitoxin (DNA-binding transcriptional repressor) of toxin-antitoxin stability system
MRNGVRYIFMLYQVPFEDAPRRIQSLIGEAMAGEEVVFTRGEKPVLKLVPIENSMITAEAWRKEMRALRGLLTGIDTTVPREHDRAL